jgi:two-component system OmpR family response regulator
MPKLRVLLVEDDRGLAGVLQKALGARDVRVDLAVDGPSGLQRASSQVYDVVILDVRLPGFDGLEVLKRLRGEGSTVPVIVLTAWGEEEDVVQGLYLGADDYLRKPVGVSELLARIHNVHRRVLIHSERGLKVGDVELDSVRGTAVRSGRTIRLTPTESDLLRVLMSSQGVVLSRGTLLNTVWGMEFEPGTNLVAVYVHRLRTKLEKGGEVRIIHTVPGQGYMFGVRD